MNSTVDDGWIDFNPSVWVGFTCAVLSAAGSTASLMIVRLSTQKEAHLPLCQRKYFFIGSYANLACEVGLTSVALALAPLALISPTSGLSICFSAIYAWLGLCGIKKEKATAIEFVALLITVAGVAFSFLIPHRPSQA